MKNKGDRAHTASALGLHRSVVAGEMQASSHLVGPQTYRGYRGYTGTPRHCSPALFLIKSSILFHPKKRVCVNPMLIDSFGQFIRRVSHLKEYLSVLVSLSQGP